MKTCSVQGCRRKHYAKGLCEVHYLRARRHGGSIQETRKAIGMGTINSNGYMVHGIKNKKYFEHILVVEKVLGRSLPSGVIIHHVNGNRSDNKNTNLVVCQDNSYHKMLHARIRTKQAGFPIFFAKCPYCKKYDDPFHMHKAGKRYRHSECISQYDKIRYRRRIENERTTS